MGGAYGREQERISWIRVESDAYGIYTRIWEVATDSFISFPTLYAPGTVQLIVVVGRARGTMLRLITDKCM